MQALHRSGGVAPEPRAQHVVAGQLQGGGHEPTVIVDCHAVLVGAQVLARRAVVEGHRRHAAGHRLQGDVAEGFAAAGKQEQVAAGEVAGQGIAALHAAENEVGVFVRQLLARGAIAHPDEACLGPDLLEPAKRLHCQAEVLLRCDPAHVDGRKPVAVDAPFFAQGRVAALRLELAAVHRAGQQADPVEALLTEELLQLLGRHQGGIGLVVEASHPAQGCSLQPGHAVVGQVFVETGVEAAGHRNAEPARGAQRRPAERAFGGDVDGIGALLLPLACQSLGRGQAKAQAGIAWQSRAGNQQGVLGRVGFAGLARADQVDLVAGCAQSLFQSLHGQGNAVDFGGVRFSDDGIAHGGPPVWGHAGRTRCSRHDAGMTAA
ncbi:hypothetical protein D3C71_996530 [compost metagenome]